MTNIIFRLYEIKFIDLNYISSKKDLNIDWLVNKAGDQLKFTCA